MIEQGITSRRLRIIFDKENRKGNSLYQFLNENNLFIELKRKRRELISYRSHKDEKYILLKKNINYIETKLDKEVNIKLEQISERIKSGFDFVFQKRDVDGIPMFYLDKERSDNAEFYFLSKCISFDIKKKYNIKQSSRQMITAQLVDFLSDKLPKDVVRLDVSHFFQQVNFDNVITSLECDSMLPQYYFDFIRKIREEVKKIAPSYDGLPKGIGISSVLSEYYFNKNVKLTNSNIFFFARFVDDIIVICHKGSGREIYKEYKDTLEKHNLPINMEKSKVINDYHLPPKKFDFLGYNYSHDKNYSVPIVTLSTKKMEKYRNKIQLSIDDFKRNKKRKSARRLLIARLKLITRNVRLYSAKNNILAGVYFSNSLCTNIEPQLRELDKYLRDALYLSFKDSKIKIFDKLKKQEISFLSGYKNRKIYNISTQQIGKLSKIWKNA